MKDLLKVLKVPLFKLLNKLAVLLLKQDLKTIIDQMEDCAAVIVFLTLNENIEDLILMQESISYL